MTTLTIKPLRMIALVCFFMMLAGCGPKRPVFYANEHYASVGDRQARIDTDQCMAEAKAHGADTEAGQKVASRAAKAAVLGAATSTVVSAVLGGDIGRAAGAGAAGGATAGAVHGAFEANDPDQVFKRYVERCLKEKGYEVIGWR